MCVTRVPFCENKDFSSLFCEIDIVKADVGHKETYVLRINFSWRRF